MRTHWPKQLGIGGDGNGIPSLRPPTTLAKAVFKEMRWSQRLNVEPEWRRKAGIVVGDHIVKCCHVTNCESKLVAAIAM